MDGLAGQSGGHRPYRDDTWGRLKAAAANGERPDGWETVPWCGSCDEITRTYPDGDELKYCVGCHPEMRF